MAGDKSSFDIIGKAWNTAKIYNNSNTVSKYRAVVESDTLQTLGNYVSGLGITRQLETRGIDSDTKSDDRLQKYNIVKITPTNSTKLDEVENFTDMYLITDEKGQDIGIYYPAAEKGQVGKFILSERFTNQTKKTLDDFSDQKDILERIVNEEYKIDNIEILSEKLSKGESLSLSKEEAKYTIKEEYRKKGLISDDKSELTQEERIEQNEEQEALNNIPPALREQAVKFAKENSLKIKDILIIKDPEAIMNNLDNDRLRITKDGGPVILLRTGHGGADSLGDDVYVAQAGKSFIHDEKEDDKLESVTDVYKGEDTVPDVQSLDFKKTSDQEKQLILESELRAQKEKILQEQRAREIYEKIKEIEDEQKEIEIIRNQKINLESQDFESPEDKEKALAELDLQIAGHEEKIQILKGELEAYMNEKETTIRQEDRQVEKHKEGEESEDAYEKSRWDSADPNQPKH